MYKASRYSWKRALPTAIEILKAMFEHNLAKQLQFIHPSDDDTVAQRIDNIARD